MTEPWFKSNFPVMSDGSVIVYTDNETAISTDINWVVTETANITTPNYVELSALSIASQGWQKIFDQWKEKGIAI